MGEAAPVIERPTELDLPDADKFRSIRAALKDQGRTDFMNEIVESIYLAQARNDLRPVQHTIDAWWHSLQFATLPGIDDALKAASTAVDREPGLTIDEIRQLLGV